MKIDTLTKEQKSKIKDDTGVYVIHGKNLTKEEFVDPIKLHDEKKIDNLELVEMLAYKEELV